MFTNTIKKIRNSVEENLSYNTIKSAIKRNVSELSARSINKNVRIAVTGLSGAGKSAFIASMINQLTSSTNYKHLPLWGLHSDEAIMGAKLIPYDEMHIPSFAYQEALSLIYSEEPEWPQSTQGISQARVCVRYRVQNKLVKKVQPHSYLNIDVIDYPGEWLIDLPMLSMNFKQWSLTILQWLNESPHHKLADEFLRSASKISLDTDFDQESCLVISSQYKKFLLACKDSEQSSIGLQPGRFILPGDLKGAPVLEFFPILNKDLLDQNWSELDSNNLLKHLERRYDYYRDEIVKPFYREYFSKVDRQILLVDAQDVMNQGYASYQEHRTTLANIVSHYNYGQSNWFKRLFKPSIDKLVIAATKADHVPANQHKALLDFIDNMLINTQTHARYEGVSVETLTLSSIAVTEQVTVKHDNKDLFCIKGLENSGSKEQQIVNYPGKIPVRKLSKEEWHATEFNFISFALPKLDDEVPLPHIRMDKAIELLVGDLFL